MWTNQLNKGLRCKLDLDKNSEEKGYRRGCVCIYNNLAECQIPQVKDQLTHGRIWK